EPFTTPAGDNPGVADVKAALEGARMVLTDRFSEDAELLAALRQLLCDRGVLTSQVLPEKAEEGAKFRDYFEYSEPLAKVPPHRALALFRGRASGVLKLALKLPEELEQTGWSIEHGPCERLIAGHYQLHNRNRPADTWLAEVVRMTWRTKLSMSIETTLLTDLRETAEEEAIRVFARNLHDLLLAAPAGQRVTMGLDPGIRTGVKVAVVDANGKLLDTATIYPFQPRKEIAASLATLTELSSRHKVDLVAIGNGTASRETQALLAQLMRDKPALNLHSVMVSEAGASVYSASAFAANEFPELDVSLRGAVSIARRLQDPLAELVKIDPQSIGVGQYQHDVSQARLSRSLDAVVEDCVNSVGVDVNTASVPLLSRIAGLSPSLAENVVTKRDQDGAFRNRKDLLSVPRLGPKAFEQAAGFLRINGGDNPLDASAVHPEAYTLVARILKDLNKPISEVLREPSVLKSAQAQQYVDAKFGLLTVQDILRELEKPGRDPRPEFKTATFADGVNDLKDLTPAMVLEGVVTNVTNFGAFVDVGVHQDGLVHISMLADRFVKDPHEVVKAGDVVHVKVLEVDVDRKRISLSMRLDEKPPEAPAAVATTEPRDSKARKRQRKGGERPTVAKDKPKPEGAMANAFAKAFNKQT
ncbi:MAG: Tex family protein, partial [Proteobacteria bacterium]|nr:Tex family protein [Pseudomonadota bacterium]